MSECCGVVCMLDKFESEFDVFFLCMCVEYLWCVEEVLYCFVIVDVM